MWKILHCSHICNTDINECEDTNPCDSETEKCTNTIGNYSCTCQPGYNRDVQGVCKGKTYSGIVHDYHT